MCYNNFMNRFKRPLIYLGIVLIAALSLFCLAGCGSNKDVSVGKDLTEFASTTLEGEDVNPSLFADHDMTLINFWATFCGPCINEMPDLAEIHNDQDGEGVNVVGIITDVQNNDYTLNDELVREANVIIKDTNANYTHLVLSQSIEANIVNAYKIDAVPTSFLVDNTGKVIGGPYVGSKSKSEWLDIIDEVRKNQDD